MTWVIGLGSPFGYGVAVSDVQVTFDSGETLDCLLKAFAVAARRLPTAAAVASRSMRL